MTEKPPDHGALQPQRLELVFGLDSIPPAAPHKDVLLPKVERRLIRSLAAWIALTGIGAMAIGGVCIAQWVLGRGNVPSAVLLVLSSAIGFWSVMAGIHLGRVVAKGHRDAHELVRAFSHLRSIFILRAISLFLLLALSCFAFSIVASFLALIS